MNYWLVKTEPTTFSFADLMKAKNQITHWEGVRNYQARNFLRNFKLNDFVLVYHSNVEEPAIIGVAQVVREAYPDPFALDSKSKYFDERAYEKGKNPWVMVDLQGKKFFPSPITRKDLQSNKECKNMQVLIPGSRLSVLPVTKTEFTAIEKMKK